MTAPARKPNFYIYIVGALGLMIAIYFCIRAFHHKPKSQVVMREIPDYSGIVVDDVIKESLKSGKGEKLKPTDHVRIRYQMWIYDPAAPGNHGKELSGHSTQERKLTLGSHEVIAGLEEGLTKMTIGEEATLIIPPDLAYGTTGSLGAVPGGAIIQVQLKVIAKEM